MGICGTGKLIIGNDRKSSSKNTSNSEKQRENGEFYLDDKTKQNKLKNSVCEIYIDNQKRGNGLLCLISFFDTNNQLKKNQILITCDYIMIENGKKIKLKYWDIERKCSLNNKGKLYIDKSEYMGIIEFLSNEKKDLLEIDPDILQNNWKEQLLQQKSIIIYPFQKTYQYYEGIVNKIEKSKIKYNISRENIPISGLILNKTNFKIIGIHQKAGRNPKEYIGLILRESILNFIKIMNNKKDVIKRFDNVNKIGGTIEAVRNEALGKYTYKNGNLYIGGRKNNMAEGQGTELYKNGDKYEGCFQNDKKQGKGRYLYTNGDKYEGNFHNDNSNGYGIYYYANGDIYKGNWVDNKKEGKGVYFYKDNDKYDGEYKNDKPNGKGIYYFNNNDKYDGYFKDGKMEGQGTMYFQDGNKFIGIWKNGGKEGEGTLYYKDGKQELCSLFIGDKIGIT